MGKQEWLHYQQKCFLLIILLKGVLCEGLSSPHAHVDLPKGISTNHLKSLFLRYGDGEVLGPEGLERLIRELTSLSGISQGDLDHHTEDHVTHDHQPDAQGHDPHEGGHSASHDQQGIQGGARPPDPHVKVGAKEGDMMGSIMDYDTLDEKLHSGKLKDYIYSFS